MELIELVRKIHKIAARLNLFISLEIYDNPNKDRLKTDIENIKTLILKVEEKL